MVGDKNGHFGQGLSSATSDSQQKSVTTGLANDSDNPADVLASVFEQNELHGVFASRATELWVVIVLILELVNFLNEFFLIHHLLIMPRLLVFAVPKVTENYVLSFMHLIHGVESELGQIDLQLFV